MNRPKILHASLVAVGVFIAAAIVSPMGGSPASADSHAAQVQQGDLLLPNHGFEQVATGWTAGNGKGAAAPKPCRVLTTSTTWASEGTHSLSFSGRPPCIDAGAVSTPVPVTAGQKYSAFSHLQAQAETSIALRWLNAQGTQVGRSSSQRKRWNDTVEVTAVAPAGATTVAVELGAHAAASFDDVLITAPYTVLQPQITKQASFLSMAAGVDENGRHVTYAMATGSENDPAVLTITDILTGNLVRNVELPGATGAWGVRQNPVTKTVYIGAYQSAQLWLYTPGEAQARRIGAPPIAAWGSMYDIDFDDQGTAYGSGWGEPTQGFRGAVIFKYVEGTGFQGTLGPNPLTTDAYYTRTLAYEDETKTIFTGTGTKTHLFGCSTVGEPRCKDLIGLFSPELQNAPWVYGVTAGHGYVMAWAGDASSQGKDSLVVLKVSRDAAGELQATKVTEIKGVIYNGSSPVVDGKIYYSKANDPGQPLYGFDLAAGTEAKMPNSRTGIFSRRWEAVSLGDPAWPGTTLVGWNSGAVLVKYNLQTGTLVRTTVQGVPLVSTRVNSITTGPDGRIWTAGYLTGGLGKLTSMRDDEHVTYPVGGQAESMLSYRGRVYQGTYPYTRIESFTPDDVTSGRAPRVDCSIGANQNRPYGLAAYGDRIYYGTQAEYGHDQGAFGWLDLTTGQCTTLDGVIGHQSVNAIAASGDKVFGGGSIFYSYDGLPIDTQAKLLIFDQSTQQPKTVIWPVPDTRSVDAAVTAPDGTVWFYAEGWLLAIDPATEQWVHREHVFPDLTPPARVPGYYATMLLGADGKIYGNVAGRVFDFDPAHARTSGSTTGDLRILFEGAGPHLTRDAYGNLYAPYGATKLVRINPR
ncbi:hypothetical protein E0H73_16320 [Kribbella pittospori]|uniref:CBM-cenC domain-containing protein n=1 Tax=Kribbella pittospori TaxID=722689 RepID=A0A4R0KVB7_9ACTN|nr:hypothetical protein [Kribbella pittospori]TCC62268.1 hypothetical protein E0H73_16320 [Kribbella pittospori]